MAITRTQIARQLYRIGGVGGRAEETEVERPGGNGDNSVTSGTLSDPREKQDFFTQAYKPPGLFGIGGGYRDLNVPGDTSKGFKQGIGSKILGGILGLINPLLGFGYRALAGTPGALDKFQRSRTLEEFRDRMRGYGRTMPTIFNNPNFDQMIDEEEEENKITIDNDMSIPMIPRISESDMSLATPEQKRLVGLQKRFNFDEGGRIGFKNGPAGGASAGGNYGGNRNPEQEYGGSIFSGGDGPKGPPTTSGGDGPKPFLVADALTTPTAGAFGFNLRELKTLQDHGYDPEEVSEGGYGEDLLKALQPIVLADGGRASLAGGGIMDAAGRQGYFLGKLVKKITRPLKKIIKSPVGKLGLLAAGGFGLKSAGLLKNLYSAGKLTGMGKLALGAGISSLPLLFGQEEEEQPTGFTGSVGGQIDPRAYTDPYGVLFPAFRAEGSPKEGEKGIMKVASAPDIMDSLNDLSQMLFGKNLDQLTDEEYDALQDAARDSRAEGGSMKEPVAKKTMPLLDMDGKEMDLRAEGGFVPIGRMEKADDVPARLSKNEFVFTADAVRNAGDGDVDKGAEVMYNMMKNLESGGDVSEESQGLEGARNMFQTSKRLEEVI